jgi:hypothetical protein
MRKHGLPKLSGQIPFLKTMVQKIVLAKKRDLLVDQKCMNYLKCEPENWLTFHNGGANRYYRNGKAICAHNLLEMERKADIIFTLTCIIPGTDATSQQG